MRMGAMEEMEKGEVVCEDARYKMQDARCRSNLFLHPGFDILPEKAKEFQ